LASAIQVACYEVWFPVLLLKHDLAGISFDGLKERLESKVAFVHTSRGAGDGGTLPVAADSSLHRCCCPEQVRRDS
jgi:hypothetical protein